MPMFLGFPHIVEEAAAHLFGVPHGHKHCASSAQTEIVVVTGEQVVLTSSNDKHTH